MEKDFSTKLLRYAGSLFLLVGAVIMVWQVSKPSWFENIKAEVTDQPYARTITVSGTGKISAKPDIATVTFSVESKGTTVNQVTTSGNTTMTQVIAAIQGLGVQDKDIETSQYDLNPEYDYSNPNGMNKIIGYDLTQGITVTIRDLTKSDGVVAAATNAGANNVGTLTFGIDDNSPLKQQARAMAFQNAAEIAQEEAQEAGVSLGRIITFSEESAAVPAPRPLLMMDVKAGGAAAAPAPSLQPGQQQLTETMDVTYEIN